jgi:hypothetical protein
VSTVVVDAQAFTGKGRLVMSDNDIEKDLENLAKAERRVEQDEARLVKDKALEREALEELEKARRDHLVTIFVGKADYKVKPGPWIVAQLKIDLGIDPAKVLAEITPQGLKDLADDAEITLHEGERFMTHARKGGSS